MAPQAVLSTWTGYGRSSSAMAVMAEIRMSSISQPAPTMNRTACSEPSPLLRNHPAWLLWLVRCPLWRGSAAAGVAKQANSVRGLKKTHETLTRGHGPVPQRGAGPYPAKGFSPLSPRVLLARLVRSLYCPATYFLATQSFCQVHKKGNKLLGSPE